MVRQRSFPAAGLAAAVAWLLAMPAAGAETLPGPIPAVVLRVLDGDTVEVEARIWLGQKVRTEVRLLGIDAPELRGQCPAERELARQAKELLTHKLAAGTAQLREVNYDKYGGRVLARVYAADGTDLAQSLIAAGLARAYDGGRRTNAAGMRAWCAPA